MSKPEGLFPDLPEVNHIEQSTEFDYRSELRSRITDLRRSRGSPAGLDEALLENSLPPLLTLCPNPFVSDLVADVVDDSWEQPSSPLASDIAVGKNDPYYFLHYYSTKVPPDAIIPFLLHHTKPGDLVLDAFCGTGMTGVAAQLCSDQMRVQGRGEVGARRAVLSDLSPAAAFIAAGTNAVGRLARHLDAIESIVEDIEDSEETLLRTNHVGWPRGTIEPELRVNRPSSLKTPSGRIEYVVWSDVFLCSSCSHRIVFWDAVFRGPKEPEAKTIVCPGCGSHQSRGDLERAWFSSLDPELGEVVQQAEQVPVLINYEFAGSRFEKTPDSDDLEVLAGLSSRRISPAPPVVALPGGLNTEQPRRSHGFTHVHHFFTRRNLLVLSRFWHEVRKLEPESSRLAGLYVLTGAIQRVCRLNRYMPNHDRHVGPLSGTLYVAPLTAEIPATNYLRSRIRDIQKCAGGPTGEGVRIGVGSATDLSTLKSGSVDFIFTDPPFGGNLNYSELNILVEAWLGLFTEAREEAVVNSVQGKSLVEYQKILEDCFREYARVLKPGRWIVVEFNNSSNAVWYAIQQALGQAGFVVADVRTLDKKKGTTKQLSFVATTKQDLVISAYRPAMRTVESLSHPEENSAWTFVRSHLAQLPVVSKKSDGMEVIVERQAHRLFDRMTAFHVQHGFAVPLSSREFLNGLSRILPDRDGMYFLPEQVSEYDSKRAALALQEQESLFVVDEASAIQWIRQQLREAPQTFKDLQPRYMRETQGWVRHEEQLELMDVLKGSFLHYDGNGPVPSQIHGYLSSNYKDLRNLDKVDVRLVEKARGRWYVPDPNKQADLEQLRENSLLKEFEDYETSPQRKLKVFRTEAMRAGFKACWQKGEYRTIVKIAEMLPYTVLQEDEKLLMYYDNALTRLEDK